jgi:hypothetical protein
MASSRMKEDFVGVLGVIHRGVNWLTERQIEKGKTGLSTAFLDAISMVTAEGIDRFSQSAGDAHERTKGFRAREAEFCARLIAERGGDRVLDFNDRFNVVDELRNEIKGYSLGYSVSGLAILERAREIRLGQIEAERALQPPPAPKAPDPRDPYCGM